MKNRHTLLPFRGAFIVSVFAMLVHSHTALSAEWQEISQEESRLAIDAPGLDEASLSFGRKKEGAVTSEYGGWVSHQGRFPRAELFAVILYHNFHWPTAPFGDLKSETKDWGFLESKEVVFDHGGKYGNSLGRGEFMTFAVGNNECFAFHQYWGEPVETRGVSRGTRYLTGYYCGEANVGVDQETMHAILDSVRAPR